ncbi:hypothetical protein KXD93_03155 [Mucilaginibacter sp. BJC16-A38]|uniref:hypothetical protein n=1 Tax=Mucilaginibacter phenanthrenivorans TaxID=1234842 RepID=UPI0021582C52|nr:hypothetical protein [Mucilaginibacter phenanthrenivorans]MCR8556619.1 hypothetical protein [Mucilaginibacter phenanthrenivorans]
MKITVILLVTGVISVFFKSDIQMDIVKESTIDSLGACQGVSIQHGKALLYGDREVGMIRQFSFDKDTLVYDHKECKLTIDGKNIINHPTGIAYHGDMPVFMGNSVKPPKGETAWKAFIYYINWNGLWKTGTLDGNLLKTIEDDACIQGTRPEYVKYHNKWYVATADYGNHGNEVRLYDPERLSHCSKTSEPGVLYKKFTCTPWVQNLYWLDDKGIIVLIQNQIEGRKWRFTYVDLEKSIQTGQQEVIKEVNVDARGDELEGFAFTGQADKGIAVTSSRKNNVNYMHIGW